MIVIVIRIHFFRYCLIVLPHQIQVVAYHYSLHFNSSKLHWSFPSCGSLILLSLQSLPPFLSPPFQEFRFTGLVLAPVRRILLTLTPLITQGAFSIWLCTRCTAGRFFKWSPVSYIPRISFSLRKLRRVVSIALRFASLRRLQSTLNSFTFDLQRAKIDCEVWCFAKY